MSVVAKVELVALRQRLVALIAGPISPRTDSINGSLYLRALACCWLAAEDGSPDEQQLERLYYAQALAEQVSDPDRLLSDIILVAVAS